MTDSLRLILKPLQEWCATRIYARCFFIGLEIPMVVTYAPQLGSEPQQKAPPQREKGSNSFYRRFGNRVNEF